MQNAARSERSRNSVIQAALAIIARDGPGQLTLDAIARESGISKGGVTHQFRNKDAVLKALIEHQIEYFDSFALHYRSEVGETSEPSLASEIAALSDADRNPHSVALAVLGALSENPRLLSALREIDAEKIAAIKAEAVDPELAVLRWAAAKGLMFATLLGLTPLPAAERAALFDRLLDEKRWLGSSKT